MTMSKIPYEKPLSENWDVCLECRVMTFSNEKPGEDDEPLTAPVPGNLI